jgi:hypothetical protein
MTGQAVKPGFTPLLSGFKPIPERAPSKVLCFEAIVTDPQPRVQVFRLPDGSIGRGMVLNKPCTEAYCDHPLSVQIAVDRIVTWPSSWRVSS